MKLSKLSLFRFRNLKEAELVPSERFNIFYGGNAQGKTNLLESIYLLGTMKSFRMARSGELVSWGADSGMVRGSVERDGVTRDICLAIDCHGKRARVDQKHVVRLSDFFGNLNVVLFSPEELAMAHGMPDGRRKYLDRAVFGGDAAYLTLHRDYYRILKHRNSLLRSGSDCGLGIWSEQLAEAGEKLIARRIAYLQAIADMLKLFYTAIAGPGEEAGIAYRPHLHGAADLTGSGRESLLAALAGTAADERRAGTTLVGPHRDDVDFFLNGRVLKQHASQGQLRSFVLALKMAEIEYIRTRHGNPPVLLLDDMTSELDEERNRNLMDFLKGRNMQVFITTTTLRNIMLDDTTTQTAFLVEGGKILNQR